MQPKPKEKAQRLEDDYGDLDFIEYLDSQQQIHNPDLNKLSVFLHN